MKKINILAMVLGVLAVMLIGVNISVAGSVAPVIPVLVDGNPDCGDLGYSCASFKLDGEDDNDPESGIYDLKGGTLTISIYDDNKGFDWESTLAILAVIVKGGPNANVYYYDPSSFGDVGLHAPVVNNQGEYAGLSHMEFCYTQPGGGETVPDGGLTVMLLGLGVGGLALFSRKFKQ
jgi:hypothetical protein